MFFLDFEFDRLGNRRLYPFYSFSELNYLEILALKNSLDGQLIEMECGKFRGYQVRRGSNVPVLRFDGKWELTRIIHPCTLEVTMIFEGRTPVARRQVVMNEIVEMIYQWHKGTGVKGVSHSLGFDRDTLRKHVPDGPRSGHRSGQAFSEGEEVVSKLKGFMDSLPRRPTPAKDLIAPHREWIDSLLQERQMTAKQVWKLFREKTGLAVGYCTMERYLRSQFQWGAPPVTVRLEVEPGSQAQVDFGGVKRMVDPATGKPRRASRPPSVRSPPSVQDAICAGRE